MARKEAYNNNNNNMEWYEFAWHWIEMDPHLFVGPKHLATRDG